MKSIKTLVKTRHFKITPSIAAATLVTVSLLLNLFTYGISFVRYYGSGMEPALSSGQVLLVQRTSRVSEGDIIAFYYNNKVLVRRVICTGGSRVSINSSGTVSVNGAELDEPYVESKSLGQCSIDFPFDVPADSFFVMGDSRAVAMDSRLKEIGTISADRIIGRVVFSIIPFKSVG
ncbi:MAG: signal peptidase I [Oscillospiraceae bacterium]|nr:signal peptidase I [Oscillospiraceae bacterium]